MCLIVISAEEKAGKDRRIYGFCFSSQVLGIGLFFR